MDVAKEDLCMKTIMVLLFGILFLGTASATDSVPRLGTLESGHYTGKTHKVFGQLCFLSVEKSTGQYGQNLVTLRAEMGDPSGDDPQFGYFRMEETLSADTLMDEHDGQAWFSVTDSKRAEIELALYSHSMEDMRPAVYTITRGKDEVLYRCKYLR